MDKISFIDSDTQKQINAPLNGTLIHGTHRMCDLIPAMLNAIRDTAEYAQLSTRLPSVVTDPSASEWDDRWQDDDITYLHEELTDILERYAPEGYYFGTHPGDGSDFGYWRDESYMLGVITESVKEGEPLILNEDLELTYRPVYSGESAVINAHQLIRRSDGMMVGDKSHMVNINNLDEDSVQKLFEAVKTVKQEQAKAATVKEPVRENGIYSADDILAHDDKFRYQLLSRMQSDVNYFLGNGNGHEPDLWAGSVDKHIDLMYKLWDSFEEKPEWLTREQIDRYAELMRQPSETEQLRQYKRELKNILAGAGLESSPLAPKLDIKLRISFDKTPDVNYHYITCEDSHPHLYKTIEDAYDHRNYDIIEILAPSEQLKLLKGLTEYYRDENNQVTKHIDSLKVPVYAVPALLNEDFSNIVIPEEVKDISAILYDKRYAEAVFVPRNTPASFSDSPVVGQPTDCITVDVLRTDSIRQFRDEYQNYQIDKIQQAYDEFVKDHGEEPLYAEVNIRFKDEMFPELACIKLSDDIDVRDDNVVFFNATGIDDLKRLVNPNNGEDFYVVDVQDIIFQPKSLYLSDEKVATIEQVQEKAVKLFGNNFKFDYWNEDQPGTKIDRVDLGDMPDTICIDKLEIKDGQLSLYSDDIASDVDLQALDDIDISKIGASLDEIKEYLNSKQQAEDTTLNPVIKNLLDQVNNGQAKADRDYADGRYVLTAYDKDHTLGYERGFKDITIDEAWKDVVYIGHDNDNAVSAVGVPSYVVEKLLEFAKTQTKMMDIEKQLVELIGKGQEFKLSEPTVINVDDFVAKDVIDSITVHGDGTIELSGRRIDEAGASASFTLEGRDEYDLSDLDKVLDAVKWDNPHETMRQKISSIVSAYNAEHGEGQPIDCTKGSLLTIGHDEAMGLSELELPTVTSIYQDKEGILWANMEGMDEPMELDELSASDLKDILAWLEEELNIKALGKNDITPQSIESHADIHDVILRADELGIEHHPFVISGGIGVDNIDDGVDITSKEFKFASVEKDDIIVYEKEKDLFGFNSGFSVSDLPQEARNAVLDQIFDDLFAVNDPLLIVYDKKEVPSYALSAISNGDFSGIDDPEDEKNIRGFMDEYAGYLFSIDSDSRGFSNNPAFGLPTDCETVFIVKHVTPKELLDQQKEKALLEGYQSAGLGGNGTQFWPDKGMLGTYQAFAFKDNSILLFKDANSEGIRLSVLPHEERQRIMDTIASLRDRHLASQSRKQLMNVLDSARDDIGDVILIQPTPVKIAGLDSTVTAVFLAPDGKGGGEYRLTGEDYVVLAVEEAGVTEFNACKILSTEDSIDALTNAVRDTHINVLEKVAKDVIRERIITPSARSFTSGQVDLLNHYHEVVTPDTPASEAFSRLLDEVAQEPDVARKPEKWVNDTARELDGLAEGITRESGQGLKR